MIRGARAIARKELRDGFRSRWLLGYALLLAILGGLAAWTGLRGSEGLALQTFGRTAATLTNLCLFLVPLVALALGSATIAGEKDRGTLDYLLAQPMSRAQLLLGKYFGLLCALVLATALGFAPAAALILARVGASAFLHFAVFPLLASLLAAAMLAIGLLISVSSSSWVGAQSAAIFVWFGCVVLYDLLLMSVLLGTGLPASVLAVVMLLNPADAVRVLVVLSLEPDLYLLGPAGAWLIGQLGATGTAVLLLASSSAWTLGALALALQRFRLTTARVARQRLQRGSTSRSGEPPQTQPTDPHNVLSIQERKS